jgi:DNA polymerase-3 subunit gamma/tau
LTGKEIIGRLKKLADSEDVKISEKILERIARLSEGGLRDAESLLGQLLSFGVKDITEEDADLVLPRADLGAAFAFLEFLVYKNGREAMLLISELSERGADFKYFFDNTIELARKLLFVKITGETDAGLPDEIKKSLQKMCGIAALPDITKILDVLLSRRGDVRLLDIPSLPLELSAAEICGDPSSSVILSEGKTRVEESRTPISISTMPIGDLSEITSKWPEVLEKIKNYNHSLPFIIKMSEPRSFDGKNLVLAIKFKLHKDKLEDPKSYSVLTEVLKSVYNKEIFIRPEVDTALSVSVPNEEDVDAESAFGS